MLSESKKCDLGRITSKDIGVGAGSENGNFPLLYLMKMFLRKGVHTYSVVSIKRTGLLNYFEVFYQPEIFFHVLNGIFLPP